MSIVNELKRIENNIKNSYTALADKGAELPQEQNSDNLASTINSIQAGGGSEFADILFTTGLPAKLVVPNNCKSIRDNAFRYLSSYKIWTNTLEEVSGANVEEIGVSAFQSQNNLKKIDFPNARRVGKNSFYLASTPVVEYLRLGELEYIGANAFQYLFRNDFDFQFSLAQGCEIDSQAFYGCGLTSFDFTGVKSIGGGCFYSADKKMKIWLPSTVKTINASAATQSFWYNGSKGTIYTDVVDENSVPAGWGANWKYGATVVYGATYEDYKNA